MASRLVLQRFDPTLPRCHEPFRTHSAMASLVKWLSTATVGMAAGEVAASGPDGSRPRRSLDEARRRGR